MGVVVAGVLHLVEDCGLENLQRSLHFFSARSMQTHSKLWINCWIAYVRKGVKMVRPTTAGTTQQRGEKREECDGKRSGLEPFYIIERRVDVTWINLSSNQCSCRKHWPQLNFLVNSFHSGGGVFESYKWYQWCLCLYYMELKRCCSCWDGQFGCHILATNEEAAKTKLKRKWQTDKQNNGTDDMLSRMTHCMYSLYLFGRSQFYFKQCMG